LIESLNEGIWMIDEKAVTTLVNPRMVEMLGYTVEEVLGRPLFSFMDEQGVQLATRNLARGQQGIKELHEFEFLRKDGTRIYTRLASAPITDLDGTYRGAVAGVLDITERKRTEEQIERQLKELQRWQDVMLGREERVLEVKKEVNELLARLGQPPRYLSVVEGQDEKAVPAAPGGPELLKKTSPEALD
jgi:PAS domain S-box-containing protein